MDRLKTSWMRSSFSVGIFHCEVFALGVSPDPISHNFDRNSRVLKTSTSSQELHPPSSWCFSSLIFSEPLPTLARLFIRRLLLRKDCESAAGLSFYFFVSSIQAAGSEFRPAWGRVDSRKAGAAAGRAPGAWRGGRSLGAGRNVEGRGLPAERGGRARPRLAAAGWARGYRGGGQSRMLVGSVRLQPFSSPGLRQLAPAGDGDLAALCRRTLLFHPRGSPGESQVPPGEAGVPERPRNARRQLAPSGNRDRRAFSSACNAGRAGGVGSTAWEGATRTPMMDAPTWRAGCCCLLLLALVGSTRSQDMPSCEEVRKLFQWRLVGGVKGLPDSPRAGEARRAGAECCAWARAGGVLSADSALPRPSGWLFVARWPFRRSGRASWTLGRPRGAARCVGTPWLRPRLSWALGICRPRWLRQSLLILEEARKADSWGQRGLTAFLLRVEISPLPHRGASVCCFLVQWTELGWSLQVWC